MTKLTTALLFLTLILGACSPGISSTEAIHTTVTPLPPTSTSETPKIIVTVGTPNIGQPPDVAPPTPTTSEMDCGYQWAYKDLPELTDQLNQAIKNLNAESASHATAFGENCAASDGQIVGFAAMETDFYVILTVSDLNDHDTFGNWIAQVMQVVNGLPHDSISGPKSGFVEFKFEKSVSENIIIRVDIQQYNDTANSKTGEELFRMFYTGP